MEGGKMLISGILIGAVPFAIFWAWCFYMGYVLREGDKEFSKSPGYDPNPVEDRPDRPRISLLIPVKDEGELLERSLGGLVELSYPNYEIIVIEGESSDDTPEVCKKYSDEYPDLVKRIREKESRGKPASLNLGLEAATGEILGVLDADTRPVEEDFLQRVSVQFENDDAAAVQGGISLISPENTVQSKLSNLARYATQPYLMKGKEKIGGFIPLYGTNKYVKRTALEKTGGWNDKALTEDVDLSVELQKRDLKVSFCPIQVLEKSPVSFKEFLVQNFRQARGMIQVLFNHWRGLDFTSLKGWDTFLTLSSPLISFLGLAGSIVIILILAAHFPTPDVLSSLTIATAGALSRIRSKSSVKNKLSYVPWLFVLWLVESGIGISAFFSEVLDLPRTWTKTEKAQGKEY